MEREASGGFKIAKDPDNHCQLGKLADGAVVGEIKMSAEFGVQDSLVGQAISGPRFDRAVIHDDEGVRRALAKPCS